MILDQNGILKLIDFGFVKETSNEILLRTYCGSINYSAPEMILGMPYHGLSADIWSLGVNLFVMLNGYLPFNPEYLKAYAEMISNRDMEPNDHASEGKILDILIVNRFHAPH